MWNQNNGNGNQGYGNGYGQQDDVYGRMNNARERGGARFPFIEGSGKYALCTLEEFPHSTDGQSARALLKVIESKDGKHPVGSFVVKIWKLVKPAKFPNALTEAEEFVDFCRKLKGAPGSHPMGNDLRVLMKERSNEQLARGTIIEAVAVPNKKGTWINVYWNHVPQQPQDIAAMRQRLEQEGIPSTGGQGAQSFSQPGGVQYGAPQTSMYAPGAAPAQMGPQGYAPGAPQQYQMQQQGGWQTPPGAQVQHGPVHTTQPGYNGVANLGPAQPQQPAPQQGGFLSQLPPQGGQGGNGGQGGGW